MDRCATGHGIGMACRKPDVPRAQPRAGVSRQAALNGQVDSFALRWGPLSRGVRPGSAHSRTGAAPRIPRCMRPAAPGLLARRAGLHHVRKTCEIDTSESARLSARSVDLRQLSWVPCNRNPYHHRCATFSLHMLHDIEDDSRSQSAPQQLLHFPDVGVTAASGIFAKLGGGNDFASAQLDVNIGLVRRLQRKVVCSCCSMQSKATVLRLAVANLQLKTASMQHQCAQMEQTIRSTRCLIPAQIEVSRRLLSGWAVTGSGPSQVVFERLASPLPKARAAGASRRCAIDWGRHGRQSAGIRQHHPKENSIPGKHQSLL